MLKYFLCTLVAVTNVAVAQRVIEPKNGRLTGKVADAATNEALPFASVQVYRPLANKDSLVGGATASETGQFSVGNLPAGRLVVKVSFLGYKDSKKSVQ